MLSALTDCRRELSFPDAPQLGGALLSVVRAPFNEYGTADVVT
jgi:hypothetical protein